MTPRRVLQIVHGREVGGVLTLAETLGSALAADGCAVELAFLFPPGPAGALAKLAGVARTARQLLGGGYDAVIAYQSTGCLVAGVVGRLASCPIRVAHQTALPSEVRGPLRWLDRLAGSLGFYTHNVLNSGATADAFRAYPRRYRRRMTLIEHGVRRPVAERGRAATLAGFGVPDDGPILLNVGRLTGQKNQAVLLPALRAIPSARLVVAGDGPLDRALTAAAEAAGVAGRLHLVGPIDRQGVADLLGAADLFVFPSTWETFGLATVEAAMAGLPVVASDLDVLREVLADSGVPVRFAPPGDAAAWTEAVAAALADPAARPLPARDRCGRYTIERMVDRYRALIDGAGAGRPVRAEGAVKPALLSGARGDVDPPGPRDGGGPSGERMRHVP